MKRVEKVRLYPTLRQERELRFMLDVTRQLYNAALQERREAYRLRKVSISAKCQYKQLTEMRKIDRLDGRINAVYRECEDAVLHRLDLAMEAFFRRCKAGETPGYPRFKAASRFKQLTFPHGSRALRFDEAQHRVFVPGVGKVRLRKGRTVPPFGRAWLTLRNERWYASFECERLPQQGPIDLRRVLGVDRGTHVLAATSESELVRNAAVGEKRKAATARLQRELEDVTERDKRGFVLNRKDPKRHKAVLRLGRSREHESNARLDHAFKVAHKLVYQTSVIALEVLALRNMTRSAKGTAEKPGRNVAAKAGLNRVILDAGFGLIGKLIVAKAEEAARKVMWVDPKFTSQECSRCGLIAAQSRRRRRFVCIGCGYRCHADVNAALVIRRRAQSVLMSEPYPAGEAGGRARRAA
jgi:putative transposase